MTYIIMFLQLCYIYIYIYIYIYDLFNYICLSMNIVYLFDMYQITHIYMFAICIRNTCGNGSLIYNPSALLLDHSIIGKVP